MFIFLSIYYFAMSAFSLSDGSEWWRLYLFAAVIITCGEYIMQKINAIEKLLKSEGRK